MSLLHANDGGNAGHCSDHTGGNFSWVLSFFWCFSSFSMSMLPFCIYTLFQSYPLILCRNYYYALRQLPRLTRLLTALNQRFQESPIVCPPHIEIWSMRTWETARGRQLGRQDGMGSETCAIKTQAVLKEFRSKLPSVADSSHTRAGDKKHQSWSRELFLDRNTCCCHNALTHFGMHFSSQHLAALPLKYAQPTWRFISACVREHPVVPPARLSLKAEIELCRARPAIKRWLQDRDDFLPFWYSQLKQRGRRQRKVFRRKGEVDFLSWMRNAGARTGQTRSNG